MIDVHCLSFISYMHMTNPTILSDVHGYLQSFCCLIYSYSSHTPDRHWYEYGYITLRSKEKPVSVSWKCCIIIFKLVLRVKIQLWLNSWINIIIHIPHCWENLPHSNLQGPTGWNWGKVSPGRNCPEWCP